MHSQLKSEKNANLFNWKFCNIQCGGGGSSHMCTLWCAIKRQTGNFFLLMKASGKYQSWEQSTYGKSQISEKFRENRKRFFIKNSNGGERRLSSRRYGRGLYGCYFYVSWRWCLAYFGVLSFSAHTLFGWWVWEVLKKVVCMLAQRCLCSHYTRRHEGAAKRSVYRITNISIKANFPRELSHM